VAVKTRRSLEPAFRRVVILDSVSVLQWRAAEGGIEHIELSNFRTLLAPLATTPELGAFPSSRSRTSPSAASTAPRSTSPAPQNPQGPEPRPTPSSTPSSEVSGLPS
jgi:hypothetical protein